MINISPGAAVLTPALQVVAVVAARAWGCGKLVEELAGLCATLFLFISPQCPVVWFCLVSGILYASLPAVFIFSLLLLIFQHSMGVLLK